MKIILCTRELSFGAGQYIIGILEKLDNDIKIKKVLVIGPKELKGFSSKIQFDPLRLKGRFFITKEPIFALRCKKKIEKILRKEKYNLIYTCHSFLIFRKFNIPFITISHGLHKGFVQAPVKNWKIKISKIFHFLYSFFDYKTIQNADKVVFVSNKTLKEAEKFYPKYKNKFIHIPAFIDTSKFYPLNQREKEVLKRKYKLERNKKYILYVGRLEPLKGIELLIEVIKELRENVKLRLLVVGDGFLKEKVKPHAFVRYLGKIPHNRMNEIYNIADLFVLPSYYENCPLTILEAMASGSLVLASDVGDTREMLNNTQFIFQAGDKRELQIKLIQLLNLKQEEKNKIAQAFIKRVEEIYNIKFVSKKILNLYENAVKKQD